MLILWCLLIRVPLGTQTQASSTPSLVVDHGQEGGRMTLIYGNLFILCWVQNKREENGHSRFCCDTVCPCGWRLSQPLTLLDELWEAGS